MKKLIATILSVIIILSTFFSSGVVFAAEVPEDLGEMDVLVEDYSDVHYYQFYNPYKIATGEEHIAVLDKIKDSTASKLLVFTLNGKLVYEREFEDPRNVAFIDNYCFVLDWSLDLDCAYIYMVDLQTQKVKTVLADIIHDIATSNNHLYALTGSLTKLVKKYSLITPQNSENVRDKALSIDEYFTTGEYFNNVSFISASEDYVLGYQTVSGDSSIVAVSRTGYGYREITNAPKGATEISYKDGKLLVLNNEGFHLGSIEVGSTFKTVLTPTPKEKSSSENVLDPISFALSKDSTSRVYILDRNNALAIKGFNLSANSLSPVYFMIGSFSFDKGAFHSPLDITYYNGNTYVADFENERIVVRTDNRRYSSFDVIDSLGNHLKPISVGVDLYGDIIVSTKTKVLRYSSTYVLKDEYSLLDGANFTDLSYVYTSNISNEIYVLDGNKVAYFDEKTNSFTTLKKDGASASAFQIDLRNQRAFLVNGKTITVFDLKDFTKITSFDVGSNVYYTVHDIEVDFDGNLYVLLSYTNDFYLYKYVQKDNSYVNKGILTIATENGLPINKMAFDYTLDKAYFVSNSAHKLFTVSTSDFSKLETVKITDIKIPTDILDHTPSSEITVATVIDGNRVLYPLNPSDPHYIEEYANTKAVKISEGEKVIVLAETENGKMAYVLYNNIAGFIDLSTISTSNQYEDVPYKNGMTLHEGAFIYKYPLLSTNNTTPLFAIESLPKNTPVNVINRASDYVSNGIYWYYVSYVNANGQTVYGFIPRYNTVEFDDTPDVKVEYGLIEANLLQGYVEVYADTNLTLLGRRLFDKTKVKILDKSDANYYYIEEVLENGNGVVGYVLKENITLEAQTKSTMIALYLIAALIVVVVLLFVLKAVITKYKRKHIDY